ncbi:MAG: tetratricopeptide repeat protein, partial [Candidatus Rokubacteria bacterium]|nr:tetratricopeptide repeat protein [Candidatus Rokubacteria bacterium]
MTRFWIVLSAAVALVGCASMEPLTAADDPGAPADAPPPKIRDPRAAAYYFYSVAQMHARAGRVQDAIVSLREAIDRDPDTAALWVQLSQWLARANEPAKAVEAAHKAIVLEPGNATPHLTLADIFRRQRRFADAEGELEKAIQLAPGSPDAYIAL